MMVALPIDQTEAHFTFSTELDGVTYGFEFRWNHRAEQWIMAIFDGSGTALVSGIRVFVNLNFTRRFKAYGTLFPGTLFAVDTSGADRDPGFSDLGRRVVLYYAS